MVTDIEMTLAEVKAGRAELLMGVCTRCEHMSFAVDYIGEPCPNDCIAHDAHSVNYYTLCGVRRQASGSDV
jgi:hypothetical protein